MKNDYQALIDSLDEELIIQLMQELGANRYEIKERYIIFPTICHNSNADEANMKLYFMRDNKFFSCWTECGYMSIFTFLKHYYECRGIEYNWFEDILRLVERCSKGELAGTFAAPALIQKRERYQKRQNIKLPIFSNGVLAVFTKYYPPEWLEDGISTAAMDKFNILYSISQNKIIIPHHDINGNLVGIRGRALNEWEIENVGKYMPVKIEGQWYNHKLGMNLYGLYQNKKIITEEGIVYVFESEKAVMQMENFSLPNCAVAVCGSQFNKYQLNLLLKNCYPREVVICFDKEEEPGQDKYFNKLWNICKKYNQYCTFSFIYDTEKLLNLKDSPTDKGEEVFKKLLSRRVIVA